jgi:predicted metal-dependent hydrolase
MLPVYTVSIRRSKRAKRISLHIHPQGKVELVLPQRASERAGNAFIQSRHDWITSALAAQQKREVIQKPILLTSGASIPCFGDLLELSIDTLPSRGRSSVSVKGSSVIVRVASPEQVEGALEAWYRRESLAYFIGQSEEYAQLLGVSVGNVRTIQMKTQWGSCNRATRALTFNWKLALGPEEVARYVAAHEVAHLVQSNHSKAFWNVVKKLDPNYAKHRSWLKAYGGGLYLKSQ